MVSDLRHPEDEFNRLVMKVSNSHDRSMQEDICCINAVRDQAPSLAKFFPEMLAYLPHMTCRGKWKESSHCLLLQTEMGDGQSVARRAAELTQQELYVQAALVMMQGGLFLLNVQEAAFDNANGQLITDLHPANIVVTKRLEGGRHEFGICDTNGLAKTRRGHHLNAFVSQSGAFLPLQYPVGDVRPQLLDCLARPGNVLPSMLSNGPPWIAAEFANCRAEFERCLQMLGAIRERNDARPLSSARLEPFNKPSSVLGMAPPPAPVRADPWALSSPSVSLPAADPWALSSQNVPEPVRPPSSVAQQDMPQVGPTDSVSQQGMPHVTPNDSVSQQCLADERDLTGWQNLPQPVQRPLPQPVQRPIAKAEPALHAVQVTGSAAVQQWKRHRAELAQDPQDLESMPDWAPDAESGDFIGMNDEVLDEPSSEASMRFQPCTDDLIAAEQDRQCVIQQEEEERLRSQAVIESDLIDITRWQVPLVQLSTRPMPAKKTFEHQLNRQTFCGLLQLVRVLFAVLLLCHWKLPD